MNMCNFIPITYYFSQFYLLKPDHVPKPEKEDISISGNTPDENKELLEERVEAGGDKKENWSSRTGLMWYEATWALHHDATIYIEFKRNQKVNEEIVVTKFIPCKGLFTDQLKVIKWIKGTLYNVQKNRIDIITVKCICYKWKRIKSAKTNDYNEAQLKNYTNE